MSLAPGNRLGPYEIVAPIGAGGMGEVYKARDRRLDRLVAIKVSEAKFSERFEREARAVGSLNHPNICQLYDVGPDYLVMELIEGSPLGQVENLRKLLDMAVQMADGMAAAHAAGIVHRDLKPANILVTREGRVKILDFGLAKSAVNAQPGSDASTLTMTITDPGTTVGTVSYMSPEQARGEPNLTFQSDQFSFGLVLYQMASGKRAFERPSAAETMTAIIREEAEPLPAGVPLPLRWVIERLLAKDPAERYDSTRDLYRELKQIRERLSQSTSGVEAALAPHAGRRRQRLLMVPAGALVCLTAGIILTRLLTPVSGPDLSQYKFTRVALGETEERAPAWSPDGNTIAYSARVHGVQQIFARGAGAHEAAQLTRSTKDCHAPIWSPDGESIYYFADGSLWAIPASGGAGQLVLEHVEAAAIHPDGKTLAFARDGKLWLAALHGGTAKEFWPGPLAPTMPTTNMYFSPDGSYLAFDNGTVWLFSYPSGKPRKLYTGTENGMGAGLWGASWFPDGRSLLVARNSATDSLIRLAVADGSRQTIYSAGFTIQGSSVSPDGRKIVYSAAEYEWNIVEIGLTDGAVHVLVENGGTNISPDWAPSGTHFLFSAQGKADVGAAVMDQEASAGGFSRRLVDTSYDLKQARWSPDGARFVFVDSGYTDRLRLANAAGGHAILLDQAHNIQGEAWSPDGQWLSYDRQNEGQSKLAKIRALPGAGPVILADAEGPTQWSPAGDWILYSAGNSLCLISPDGKSRRTLSSRRFTVYDFSKDGRRVYGIFHNATDPNREWQLYEVSVTTGAEKLVSSLDLPPASARLSGFSIHPDGKRALTSVAKFPFQIWMLEGFEQPRAKNWFAGLVERR
jgi:Tol biopolymer transport system component/tRNA A-37 threonylcarbamoyl transferase component Bud32